MGLSVADLSVKVGSVLLLSEVHFSLKPGRICVVLGPNGAGKSTLLKALAGLVPVQSGTVTLDDQPIFAMAARVRARRIGYLAQSNHLAWDVSVAEMVQLGRHPHQRDPNNDHEAVTAALAATQLTDMADRRTGGLSGGELARVHLARILAGTPDYILADEPLASLDPAFQIDMVQRLRAVADAGTGILIVLHDVNLAKMLADDILMLKDGKVIAYGPAPTELTPENLLRLYGVPFQSVADGFQISPIKSEL